jgi:hypothetical protein
MSYVAPTPTIEPWLIGEGTEPSDVHCPILSYCVARYGLKLPFLGRAKPLGLVICLCVDCPGTWWTESFMEIPAFIGASLSDVRVIMVIMHVLVVELSC